MTLMRYGVIVVSTADLRAKPSHKSEMVSQGLLGAPVAVNGPAVGDGWLKVTMPDGYPGWMRSWNVRLMSKREVSEWNKKAIVTVVEGHADVVRSRRAGSRRIRDLVLGCRVVLLKREGSWGRIILPDGVKGWVRSRALAPRVGAAARAAAIVRTARLFLGAPYLWGGVSPKGADCSGLVQTVYGAHGLALPRDVGDQRLCGVEIGIGELRAGDLLFFGPSRRWLTHVGIASGGARFIHAGCPVEEASLDPAHRMYQRRLAHRLRLVTRILPES